jgi:hypothetical protein
MVGSFIFVSYRRNTMELYSLLIAARCFNDAGVSYLQDRIHDLKVLHVLIFNFTMCSWFAVIALISNLTQSWNGAAERWNQRLHAECGFCLDTCDSLLVCLKCRRPSSREQDERNRVARANAAAAAALEEAEDARAVAQAAQEDD